MKKLFAILSILFATTTSTSAQEKMHYKDRNIYYQNIAEFIGISSEELVAAIKSMGLNYTSIQLIYESGERLVYNVSGIASRSDEIEGNAYMTTDFIISKYAKYCGLLTYDIKDGRIRITFDKIQFYIKGNNMLNSPTFINDLLIKKDGTLRKRYDDVMIKSLALSFDTAFIPTLSSDEW